MSEQGVAWSSTSLGEVAHQRKEVVVIEPGHAYRTMGVRWYGKGAYERGVVTSETVKAKKLFRATEGDFVFNRIDTQKGSFDVVPPHLDGALATNEFPLYITDDARLLARYLLLYFQKRSVLNVIDGTRAGSEGRARWKEADFEAWRMPLPPIPVQERIVEVISAIDDQIIALEAEARAADALWWALARQMVRAVAGSDSARLDSIADISGGLTKNKKDVLQPDLVEVPYLRVANVHRHSLVLSDVATIKTTRSRAEALRLLTGDVLMNEGGDKDKLGRGAVWEGQIEGCIHQNHVFRVRVTDPKYDPYFVSAWGNSFGQGWFETFGTQTTGIASINKATLSRFPIPAIDLAMQQSWVARLRAAVVVQESSLAEATRLRAVRATLLTALLDREIEIDDAERLVA